MLINKNGIKVVEHAVIGGTILRLSRRPNARLSVFDLKDKDYIEVEDTGDKLLYKWKDQFPVQIQWENTKVVRTYEPGSVLHVVTKKA